jgi:hypothetical protein
MASAPSDGAAGSSVNRPGKEKTRPLKVDVTESKRDALDAMAEQGRSAGVFDAAGMYSAKTASRKQKDGAKASQMLRLLKTSHFASWWFIICCLATYGDGAGVVRMLGDLHEVNETNKQLELTNQQLRARLSLYEPQP